MATEPIQIPTRADGNDSGHNLKDLTGASVGTIASEPGFDNGSDLFRGRRLIVWEIPFVADGSVPIKDEHQRRFVQMYVNPQNLQINSRKLITETRTKAGYINQYWGEEFETINLQGTTGDAGIEGINVLREIYRSEQIALLNMIKRSTDNIKRRQSLMQLAASVIMWYDGQGLAGYFVDMSYTESAQKPGVFDYQLNFKATRIIGERKNFMPWHRRPHSTAKVPFKQEQVGTGMVDGDLNVPPIGDMKVTTEKVVNPLTGVKEDKTTRKLRYHKDDPRDAARGFPVARYDDLANPNGLDIIFGGLEAFVTQSIDNLASGVVDEVLDRLGPVGDFVQSIPGVEVGLSGVLADSTRRFAGGLLNRVF